MKSRSFAGPIQMVKPLLVIFLLFSWVQSSFAFVQINTSFQKSLLDASSRLHRVATYIKAADTQYDIVRVDLENGRDYPIYIGSNFDPKQGMKFTIASFCCLHE